MPLLLPTIEEERQLSWLRLMWRYRLQFQAMSSAAVVSVAGGMKLAWSVFEQPSGKFMSNARTHQLTVSWFLGVIVGVIVAASFVQRVTKNVAHCASGALLLIGGVLFITLHAHFGALVAACICEGCAYGLTQVQALVSGGELAHRNIRGMLLAGERIFLWLGVSVQLLCTRVWYAAEPAGGYALHADQLHGMLIAALGLAALSLAAMLRLESPLLLLRQQRELSATHTLKRLLGAHYANAEVLQWREDCRALCAADAEARYALPLLKVVALRCLATLALSLPFNRAFLTVSWSGFGCDMNCLWLLALCGLAGSAAGALLVDAHGRRKMSVVSLLLAGIFIFIVGGIFTHLHTAQKVFRSLDLEMAACLMLLYQFVTAAGVAVASSVYAAEAFGLSLKAPCIAAALACEQLLHCLLALVAFHVDYSSAALFFSVGSLSLLLGLLVFLFMPETKQLPLSECLRKFQKVP